MSHAQTVKQVIFSQVVLKGSAYEVGQAQGETFKSIPGLADFLRSGKGVLPKQDFTAAHKLFNQYCPGINEELQGLADSLQAPIEDILYYAYTYLRAGHCSHFAMLPSITQDHHVLVGRSYEFNDTAEDLRLCATHIDGTYAHVGFSTMLLGRGDGMNEHGLCVTMSAGGLPIGAAPGMRRPVQDGLQFWALIRTVLERCKTVEEALGLIDAMPAGGNPNLIIADKEGHAALVEIFGPHKAVKRIQDPGSEPYLCSTNHFNLPKMQPYTPTAMRNSRVRYQAIQSCLEDAAPQITHEAIKDLLSSPYPEGLCCHYYEEYFGTLRSILFDLTSGQLELCFGSPRANSWHTVTLAEIQPAQFTIKLPQEHADPSLWEQIA